MHKAESQSLIQVMVLTATVSLPFITSKLKTTAVRPWIRFFRCEPDKYCEAMLEKGEDTMGVSPWFFIILYFSKLRNA